jgi:hypothetical protein
MDSVDSDTLKFAKWGVAGRDLGELQNLWGMRQFQELCRDHQILSPVVRGHSGATGA